MDGTGAGRSLAGVLAAWGVSRTVLLLLFFKVFVLPGPDVTIDVSVIYQGWYEVLRDGTFPLDDVTWQYPPGAALAVLSPAALPFLDYTAAFGVLAVLADLAVLCLLLHGGRRNGRPLRGAWVWTGGAALLGPTLYARYDVMVAAVAVAALFSGARRPWAMGALAGFGALLKVWPALLLAGAVRRRSWAAAAVTATALGSLFVLILPGALSFLTAQRGRGTEVESLGGLVFQVARHFGWDGEVLLNYGSVEFVGPYVDVVSAASLVLTAAAFGWLLWWRLRARRFGPASLADAAFTAVLLFTATSRVISPQYLVWLVALAAVCLCFRSSGVGVPAWLVTAAALVTVLEFPVFFGAVVAGDPLGVGLLFARNGLLVAACVTACRALWRSTVPGPAGPVSPVGSSGTRATAR
ncbi:hypothetical protein C1I97_17215 [Streptomyces sp. NTH33]|uniref:glycosyltransferase family 87 protein n=1 Tax=Streptomyces sp. NTH33 TaxID=1735453 RepID=UPI000DA8DBF9|nr:glycosyltransferase family 87 protein [Streptomyces sp. NTH33]PZH07031.1 hypothetical protein C1I97_17215 [Streptomyces sp. NTH33]